MKLTEELLNKMEQKKELYGDGIIMPDGDYRLIQDGHLKTLMSLLPYTENDENQIIWMLDSKNELVSLSSCSQIVKALLKMKNQTNKRIYFPKEIL